MWKLRERQSVPGLLHLYLELVMDEGRFLNPDFMGLHYGLTKIKLFYSSLLWELGYPTCVGFES